MTIEAGNTMVPQSVEALPSGWLVLDLEVWKDRSGIRLAAYLWERGEHRLEPPQGESNLTGAQVRELVDRVRSATVVMGHNIRAFDVRILFGLAKEEAPAGLDDRICDTLELSSLFRVGQPTHRLEKLYKLSQSNNDPLEDCRESYEVYQDIKAKLLESPDNVSAEVRTWLYRLLPDECFIVRQQFFAPLEQEHIPYAWEGLNVDALQCYLETLADRKGQGNFGALVFLAWLSTYGSDQDHRPGWTDHTFSTFQEAAKIAWSFSEKGTLLRELEFFFGFKQFKAGQQEIAEALLQNDVVPLGVLPTGAGKSLCFQLPALIFSKIWGGLTVVVSPLQALMADQVSGLRQKLEEQKRNEYVDRVDLLVANQEPDEQKKILERLNNGQIDLIYLSPERLRHPLVREILIKRRPHLWVLDEAHTLSQWGHDFRPDFLRITTGIKDMYRQVHPQGTRWGFVTATATVKVVSDIQKKVKEHLEGVVANEFSRLPRHGRLFSWREEIQTAIESQPYCSPSQLADSDRLKRSAELIDQHFAALKSLDDSTLPPVAIIYVPTRKAAEQCAKALSEMQFQLGTRSGERFKAEPYHGGRKSADKKATITAFQKAEL
uniref:DEAD/DEAH box helicase n=1 Tax=Prochlorothrix hollandica TaxID=1223 RepID=UPI003340FC4F